MCGPLCDFPSPALFRLERPTDNAAVPRDRQREVAVVLGTRDVGMCGDWVSGLAWRGPARERLSRGGSACITPHTKAFEAGMTVWVTGRAFTKSYPTAGSSR